MKTPSERFNEVMRSIGPEQIAEIERRMGELGSSPDQTAWRDDPDPFGRDWDWSRGPEGERAPAAGPVDGDTRGAIPLIPGPRARGAGRRLLWVSGIAASIAAVAIGTWAAMPRGSSIREQHMAAWVAHRLVPGDGGITLSAAPEDEEADRSPMATGGDRPVDAKPPAQPNIYAPIRIQEQLVVRALGEAGDAAAASPLASVTERVRPGSLFYLEFSTAGVRGEGTAVAVRVSPGPATPLAQEVAFGSSEGTSYIGPLKMDEGGRDYLVVIADKRSKPLLDTVAATLGRGPIAPADAGALRSRLSASLAAAGHEWYGVQRINVRPDVVEFKPR